jgi:hypothetical protein
MTAYISTDDATTWLTAHVTHIDDWTNNESKQAAALEEASDAIDSLPLKGQRYSDIQEREFPRIPDMAARVYSYDSEAYVQGPPIDYSVVPQEVLDACCLEALAILQWGNSWRRKNQVQGVTQISLGGVQESYSSSCKLLSKKATEKLRFWIAGAVGAV